MRYLIAVLFYPVFLITPALAAQVNPQPAPALSSSSAEAEKGTEATSQVKSEVQTEDKPQEKLQGKVEEKSVSDSTSTSTLPEKPKDTVSEIDFTHLRDPFRRPVIVEELLVPKTELESISLDGFRLLGVSTGPARVRALLQGPTSKTYLVSENVKIGTRGGYVRRIQADKVIVREKVTNEIGQTESVDNEISMHPGQDSGARAGGQSD